MTDPERCRNGHLRTPENTMHERLKNGKTRRRCRVCRNLRNKKSHGEGDQIIIGTIELEDKTLYDNSSLTLDDRIVIAEFDKALGKVDTNCRDKPREFTDWNAGPEYLDEVPTPDFAEFLCSGCKVRKLCGKSAKAAPPAWGVRDGVVYIYGNEFTEGKYDSRNSN